MKTFIQFLEYVSPFKSRTSKARFDIDQGIIKMPDEKFKSNMPVLKKRFEPEVPAYSMDEYGNKYPPLVFTNPKGKGDLPIKEPEVNRSGKSDLQMTTIYKSK